MNEKRLILDPDPTFEVKDIKIPRPGKDPMLIDVVFRFKELNDYIEMAREMADKPLVDLLEKLIAGWGEQVQTDDPFSQDALHRLCRAYPKAGRTILRAYERELYEIEEKN